MSTPSRVLFILTSAERIGPNDRATGSYLPEVAHPWHVFRERGYEVDIVSVAGGRPPLYGEDTDDAAVHAFLRSEEWAQIERGRGRGLADIDPGEYSLVFVPGGLGPMVDMVEDERLHRALAGVYERGGVIGAVCHGPVAFMKLRLSDGTALIDGRRVTGFSNAEEDRYAKDDVPFLLEDGLREHGGLFESEPPWQAKTVVDGRVVTGQNPASAAGVATSMIAVLEAERAAE